MIKLNLKLEELTVESFETSEAEPVRGTVLGHETGTFPQIICGCSYDIGTCDNTCGASCRSCAQTCGCTTGTGPGTNDVTCATGLQIICGCVS